MVGIMGSLRAGLGDARTGPRCTIHGAPAKSPDEPDLLMYYFSNLTVRPWGEFGHTPQPENFA